MGTGIRRRAAAGVTACLAACALSAGSAWAKAGDLDSSFGLNGTGVALADAGINSTYFPDVGMALQRNGRIVVAGTEEPGDSQFAEALRFTAGGKLDRTFGQGGRFVTAQSSAAYALTIRPSGRIVIAGYLYPNDSTYLFAQQLTTSGRVDTSFGAGTGSFTAKFGIEDQATGIALAPGGKLVLGGYGYDPAYHDRLLVAQLNGDGTLDTGFGMGLGFSRPVLPPYYQSAAALAVQSNGEPVLAGSLSPDTMALPSTGHRSVVVARFLDPQGTLDPSFGSNGVTNLSVGGDDQVNAMVRQPDGKFVVVGQTRSNPGGPYRMFVLRLTATGALDPTFGFQGKLLPFGVGSTANAVALQPNGKIVIAGISGRSWVVARLGSDGLPDLSFGDRGLDTINHGSPDAVSGVAIQRNGKIDVAGTSGSQVEVIQLLGS